MKFNSLIITICASLLINSCTTLFVKGNEVDIALVKELITHNATKEQVSMALGSPSTKSDFGNEIWYYITNKQQKRAFLPPKVVERHIYAISFDDSHRALDFVYFDLKKGLDIDFSKEQTFSEEARPLNEFIRNAARFNKNKK